MIGVWLGIIGAIVVVGIFLISWLVSTYNKLVQLRERVDET